MKLYHFTCLFYLPNILEEGITRGELPVSFHKILNTANLTTNPKRDAHRQWSYGSCFDKLKS